MWKRHSLVWTVLWSTALGIAEAGVVILPTLSREQELTGLNTWEIALARFRKAGDLIGAERYDETFVLLDTCQRDLPKPYANMALVCRQHLDAALRLKSPQDQYDRMGHLYSACSSIRAHEQALNAIDQAVRARPRAHMSYARRRAWHLVEAGKLAEAITEYERRLLEPEGEDWKQYYRQQIGLLRELHEKSKSVSFALRYVREHYRVGEGTTYDGGDAFAALSVLKRVLAHADSLPERREVYRLMLRCLGQIEDYRGLRAWEERLLRECKEDAEASGQVRLAQALRDLREGRLEDALGQLRSLAGEQPETQAGLTAAFQAGLILQEQKKLPDAIREFEKLLSQPAGPLDRRSVHRHPAALQISECHEQNKDYHRALEYAQLAKHKYPFVTFCGTCRDHAAKTLDDRIRRLEALQRARQ